MRACTSLKLISILPSPSCLMCSRSSLACLPWNFLSRSISFTILSSSSSSPFHITHTFMMYPVTGITLQLIAFTRFLSFRCSFTRCSVRFFISFFTLSSTFLTSISSLSSHPRNLYISFFSRFSAYIFSSSTGNPSPLTIFPFLNTISVHFFTS